MATRPLPDVTFLRECLDYEADSGIFRWKRRPVEHFLEKSTHDKWNTRWVGKPAGSLNRDGYRLIRVGSTTFMAHRIAWILTHGEPVPVEIDHRDGNPDNNRITNIRAATRSDNLANNKVRRDSTTGIKGVYPYRGRFVAVIRRHKKRHILGYFATVQEASAVRQEAAERLHGDFARHA
jgi:hypothetical protein